MQIIQAPKATRGVSTLMLVGDVDEGEKKSIPWVLALLVLGAAYLASK